MSKIVFIFISYQYNTENDWGSNVKNYFASIGQLNLYVENTPEEGNDQSAGDANPERELSGSTPKEEIFNHEIFNQEKDFQTKK